MLGGDEVTCARDLMEVNVPAKRGYVRDYVNSGACTSMSVEAEVIQQVIERVEREKRAMSVRRVKRAREDDRGEGGGEDGGEGRGADGLLAEGKTGQAAASEEDAAAAVAATMAVTVEEGRGEEGRSGALSPSSPCSIGRRGRYTLSQSDTTLLASAAAELFLERARAATARAEEAGALP